MKLACSVVLSAVLAALLLAQSPITFLRMDQVMTQGELQETGVSTLAPAQRRALDEWLTRYTTKVFNAAKVSTGTNSNLAKARSGCSPAVESTISGEIEGWDGATVFKLDNGQIWEQAEYAYTYFYAYRPDVTIYQTDSGCRMKVEDESDTVIVRRIK
jgi:hypothetical protein